MAATESISRFSGGGALRRRRQSGFTLVEILMVVGILVGLAAILVVGGSSIMGGAKSRATTAIIERIKLYLEDYRGVTGSYPPDGFDSRVKNADGVELRGSAALHYALTTPIKKRVMIGGMPRDIEHEALVEFGESDMSEPNEDFPGVRELVDGFGEPLHYDNTMNGRFSPQDSPDCHYPSEEFDPHPPDPRTIEGMAKGGVEKEYVNQVQSRGYDLWSYGEMGHIIAEDEDDVKVNAPIATWNLNQ